MISQKSILETRPSITIHRAAVSLVLVALSALLVVYLADWSQLKLALRSLGNQPVLVVILLLTYTAAFLLRTIAWQALAANSAGIYHLFVSIQASLLVNHLAPIKAGEFVHPLLAARYGMPVVEAVATTAVARYLDFAALLAIAAIVGPAISLTTEDHLWLKGLALPAGVILGSGAVLVAMRHSLLFRWIPGPLRTRLDVLQFQLRQVSARRVAIAMLWTLPSWALEAGVIIVAARALGIELSIDAAIAVTAFTILFQVFHFTPGGIGVYEAAMTGALYAHGVPWEQGLALALATHGLKFAYSYTVALAFTLTAFGKLPELKPTGRSPGVVRWSQGGLALRGDSCPALECPE